MAAFLITGNPGSGKTTLAAELTRRGFVALDADHLAGWETVSGVPAIAPVEPSDAWLLGHRWVWPRHRIVAAVDAQPCGQQVFVCGIAMNQRDVLDLFEAVFLLSLDDATQHERLDTPSNAHRGPALRAQIVQGRPVFEHEMRDAGAVVLDGRLPTAVLADQVIDLAEGSTAARR